MNEGEQERATGRAQTMHAPRLRTYSSSQSFANTGPLQQPLRLSQKVEMLMGRTSTPPPLRIQPVTYLGGIILLSISSSWLVWSLPFTVVP